jgi:alkylhydroperoxidase family enzyme
MTDEEILCSKSGPQTPGLSPLYRLLLEATDELHSDAHVSDATWQGLSEHLNQQQLMDLVFTVGQYNLVSMALNSFGVQLDQGVPDWNLVPKK